MDQKAMINIKQHKRKIQLTSIGLILLLVLALTFTIIGTKYTPTIELTQLQNNSNSQMMGYFIKCDDKNIVVDGGTKEDSNNLQQYIKDAGGTVNAWFITHPHKDHATCFIDIVENYNIEIGKVYVTLNDEDWYKKYGDGRDEECIKFLNTIKGDKIANKVEEVYLNEKIKIDNIDCEILGIKNPEITTNAINNSSMVIKMNTGKNSILF